MSYKTILIVDDEESICQTLSGILSDEGYKVLTTGSGEEAIRIIEDDPTSFCSISGLRGWTASRRSRS